MGESNEVTQDAPECRRCEGTLDTTGYPLWCKACRAKHRREYNLTVKDMSESRGFAAGVSALRAALVQQFRLSGGSFNGAMAAHWVKNFKLPGERPKT